MECPNSPANISVCLPANAPGIQEFKGHSLLFARTPRKVHKGENPSQVYLASGWPVVQKFVEHQTQGALIFTGHRETTDLLVFGQGYLGSAPSLESTSPDTSSYSGSVSDFMGQPGFVYRAIQHVWDSMGVEVPVFLGGCALTSRGCVDLQTITRLRLCKDQRGGFIPDKLSWTPLTPEDSIENVLKHMRSTYFKLPDAHCVLYVRVGEDVDAPRLCFVKVGFWNPGDQAKYLRESLFFLGKALNDCEQGLPLRSSKLTTLLQGYLGARNTEFIACVPDSPPNKKAWSRRESWSSRSSRSSMSFRLPTETPRMSEGSPESPRLKGGSSRGHVSDLGLANESRTGSNQCAASEASVSELDHTDSHVPLKLSQLELDELKGVSPSHSKAESNWRQSFKKKFHKSRKEPRKFEKPCFVCPYLQSSLETSYKCILSLFKKSCQRSTHPKTY